MERRWEKLNIGPGVCVRPKESGKQVWKVISIDYVRQRLTIQRDLCQRVTSPEQLVGLAIVNRSIQEFPIEVRSWQKPRYPANQDDRR